MSEREDSAADAALAERVVRDGDDVAFRALYGRHTPALYQFVLRVLAGSEADAEDVVQETWIRVVRALPRFRWEAAFRTWALGIGLNAAREALRRQARRETAPLPDILPARPTHTGERMDLEQAIARLPDGYRTVLVLHDVEGFTHEEIGERLEISPGTSRSQLSHARSAMRRMLSEGASHAGT